MTRKDFEFIARTIREINEGLSAEDATVVAEKFADALSRTTHNFDWHRFMRACGAAS